LKKEKAKQKIIFVKFAPKRSTPKWTSNKMGNAKVVTPKRRVSRNFYAEFGAKFAYLYTNKYGR